MGVRRTRGRPVRPARQVRRPALRRPALGSQWRRQQDRRHRQEPRRSAGCGRSPLAPAQHPVGGRQGLLQRCDERAAHLDCRRRRARRDLRRRRCAGAHPLHRCLLLLQTEVLAMQRLLLVLLLAGCATNAPVAENLKTIPETLRPTAGESLKRVIHAKRVQVYECRDQKWVFVAPEADLYDERGNLIGRHYAGPTWQATGDGSKVVGTVKTRADAPESGAIPWLLLSTKSVGGSGYF